MKLRGVETWGSETKHFGQTPVSLVAQKLGWVRVSVAA